MRTRATLRRAELGFFGVVVYTRVHTPRRWGAATFFLRPLPDFRPGVASFFLGATRPLRTSCEVVGIRGGILAASRGGAQTGGTHRARHQGSRDKHQHKRKRLKDDPDGAPGHRISEHEDPSRDS